MIASLALTGGGKKSRGYLLTVHLESSEEEAPKFASPAKLGSESRQYYFKVIPEFTDEHVDWFYPFISKDGKSFGAAFKLEPHKVEALRGLTVQNPGKLLGIRIPNAPVEAVVIDRPIDDGVIVYWSGLTPAHLEFFEKKFPHVEDVPGYLQADPSEVSLPPADAR